MGNGRSADAKYLKGDPASASKTSLQNWFCHCAVASKPVLWQHDDFSRLFGREEVFTHVYEYVKWEPDLSGDPRVFQTPAGLFCRGRKNTKKLPLLAPQFAITIEDVKDRLQLKRTTRFWYDQNRLLARYDHIPTPAFDDFDDVDDFEGRAVREIHDFRTGLAYTIDQLRGNCSIRLLKDSIDVRPPFPGDDSPVPIMKNPMEIFHHEDSEFHYVGRQFIRHTEVDVWVGMPNAGPDAPPPENEVYEWYILSKHWRAIEGVTIETDVPMQMITYKDNFPTQVWNFHDFDSEKISVLHFDIQSCFRAFPVRKHFQFAIAGENGKLVGLIDDNINAFKEALIESIGAVTEVRPIRISNILIDDDEEFVYVLFSMTEAPLPGTGGVGIEGYPDIPLAKATTKLEKSISEGAFAMRLVIEGEDSVFINPVKDSLVETFRPGSKPTSPPSTTANATSTPSVQATTAPLTTVKVTTSAMQPTSPPSTTADATSTMPPTSQPSVLENGVAVSFPTLLVLLLVVPVCTAGCTVGVIFAVMRRLSALPH